ncbi:helix-turn-helix domain-containing protein [Actinomadura fulvescens]|uniref:Helix-turn-helix domain-containing protein n=1 Tax=Actinomadura fulvescens TaxID=46160 RepID=A0ABP6D3C9_9ACTN
MVKTADPDLTVADICRILQISPRTFYEWRAKGRAPRCKKIPNGELRIRRADFDRWYDDCGDAA